MKKLAFTFLFAFSLTSVCLTQTKIWQVELTPFFDNTEFAASPVTHDQTMAGTCLNPTIGLAFDSINRIMGGVSLLQELGSKNAIDQCIPIAYYAYEGKPFTFYMGAFPRKFAVEDYPKVFFQDSIAFYRPIMTGLSWKVSKNKNYFDVWLDWTGRQSTTQRETFFMGLNGRLQKDVFYLQHYGDWMHYAKTIDPPIGQFIHDNGLFLTSVGLDLTKKTNLDKLDINAGWLFGLERDRGTTNWLGHNGLMIDATIEYKGIGLKNTFYSGDKQMTFYSEEGNKLYWGDPVYRLNFYNRTDIFIKFFESDRVKTKFVYSLHVSEDRSFNERVFNEQALYVTVDLNNYKPKSDKKYSYLWSQKKN